MAKTQLISCVKDEGPFILEWVAHHHLLGFDDIVVFTNDCTDGTVELLQALQAHGLCRQFDNPVPKDGWPQQSAFKLHETLGLGHGFDHVMVLDADEFLNIHVGDGSLQALLGTIPHDTDLLCINWLCFADGHRTAWEPGCVTNQFQYAIPPDSAPNHQVKSIILNPKKFGQLGIHHPESYQGDAPIMVRDASLQPVKVDPENYPLLWKSLLAFPNEHLSHETAQINHYAIKTPDSYYLRIFRGRGTQVSELRHTSYYYIKRNVNALHERSIARYEGGLNALLAKLRTIPEIATAEAAAVDEYRERIALVPKHARTIMRKGKYASKATDG